MGLNEQLEKLSQETKEIMQKEEKDLCITY